MFWLDRDGQDDNRIFLRELGVSHTFRTVFDDSDRLFRGCDRGVVTILAQRNYETVVAYVGALRSGLIPLIVDSELREQDISDLVEVYRSDYIFGQPCSLLTKYKIQSSVGNSVLCRANSSSNGSDFSQLGLLLPTSGSTGDPKCVRLSYKNLDVVTHAINRYLGLSPGRVSISSLPFHYSYGLSTLNCIIDSRSTLVLSSQSWLEQSFWLLCERECVTDLAGVPFMFQILARLNLSKKLLANLKCVMQAGGAMSPMLTRVILDKFAKHDVKFYTMYGQTEAGPRISYVPNEYALIKLGSVGIPIDIGLVKTDADDGVSAGELIYHGPNVCLGYAQSREDLAKGDENFGVLRTGDIAQIDEDGFITIIGRKKRFVKISGASINLDSIERIGNQIHGEVAVVGKDDFVLILIQDGNEELCRNQMLDELSIPRRSIQCKKIERLLRLSNGKLDYMSMTTRYLK